MTVRRASSIAAILACVATGARGQHDRDAALDLELDRILHHGHRLEPLPPSVRGIEVDPGFDPIFVVPTEPATPLESIVEAYRVEHAGYRRVPGGHVAGWSRDASVMFTNRDRTKACIVGADGAARDVSLFAAPRSTPDVLRAAYALDRWIVRTRIGFGDTVAAEPWPDSKLSTPHEPVVFGDALVIVEPGRSGSDRFTIGRYERGAWTTEAHPIPRGGPPSHVLRLDDGRLLGIGSCLAPLDDLTSQSPHEEEIAALTAAAREGRLEEEQALIETISRCPATHRRAAREALASVDRLEPTTPWSAKSVARLLFEAQLYDGRWISAIDLVRQTTPSTALITCFVSTPGSSLFRRTVFRIDGAGRLHELPIPGEVAGRHRSTNALRATAAPDGSTVVLVHGLGLAAIDDAGFRWLDRSPLVREMTSLVGCDRDGRIYVGIGRTASNLWVLQEDRPLRPRAGVTVLPAVAAAPDDLGRLWFVATNATADALPTAEQVDVEIAHGADVPIGRTHPGIGPVVLFRRDVDGSLQRFFEDPALAGAALHRGHAGAMLIGTSDHVILVDEDRAMLAPSAHDLAAARFETMLEAAPREDANPYESVRPGRPLVSWRRDGDDLWIADSTAVEAYRDGAPLGIDDRLTLINAPPRRQLILRGPIDAGPKPRFLLEMLGDRFCDDVWFRRGADDAVELTPTGSIAGARGGVELGNDCNASLPIIDRARGLVFMGSPSGPIWEASGPDEFRLHPQPIGRPAFVTPSGVVATSSGARLLERDGAVREIVPAFARGLRPVAAWGRRRLLCASATGVAWLEQRGDDFVEIERFDVAIDHRPRRYLGRTDDTIFLEVPRDRIACIPIPVSMRDRP